MSVNKVILIGRLGQNPNVSILDTGLAVAKFSLATDDSYTSRTGEKITTTDWHNCVVWGKLAEIIEKYAIKGMKVYLSGKLKTRTWDDKNGVKHYTTEVICDEFEILEWRNEGQAAQPEAKTPAGTPVSTFESQPDPNNDLPF
jgi:single-strand DNA-binding protein